MSDTGIALLKRPTCAPKRPTNVKADRKNTEASNLTTVFVSTRTPSLRSVPRRAFLFTPGPETPPPSERHSHPEDAEVAAPLAQRRTEVVRAGHGARERQDPVGDAVVVSRHSPQLSLETIQ